LQLLNLKRRNTHMKQRYISTLKPFFRRPDLRQPLCLTYWTLTGGVTYN
jgi:hypothetical protein